MLEAAGTRNCGSAFWEKNFKLKLLSQLGLVEVRIRIYRLRLFCVRICAENFAIPNEIVSFFVFVLFAIFILHSRESELYRYTLDSKFALARELPFSRFMGHLSST